MNGAEAIAIVRQESSIWIAAVAFISPGRSDLEATTTHSESAARKWILEQATLRELAASDIRFME